MKLSDREIIVLTASTGIGFFSSIITYALKLPTQTKHGIKDFKFVVPKGVELVYVLGIGFISGLVINKALSYIEDNFKTEEEKLLAATIEQEEQKIKEGIIKGKKPVVTWV